MLGSITHVVTNDDPLRYLLSKSYLLKEKQNGQCYINSLILFLLIKKL